MSVLAHFFVVVCGSLFHERLAHFFVDIYIPNPIICKTNNFSLILLYLPACQKANGSACITKNLLCAQQTNTNGMQSQTGGLLGPPVWLKCGCTGKKRAAGPAKRSSFLFSKIYRWLSHHLLCLSLIFEPKASQGRLPAVIPPGRPAQTPCRPSFYYGLEIFFKSS